MSLSSNVTHGLPTRLKPVQWFLNLKESPSGISHVKFMQDTGTVFAPKAAATRSLAELFESGFVEFVESAFFYYVSPLSARHGFTKLFQHLSPAKPDLKTITTPLAQLSGAARKAAIPVKAANFLCGFGIVTISGEYALNFVKNLLTEGIFRKNAFSDVVNLSKTDPQEKPLDNGTRRKALNRILQCWGIGLGLLGTGAAISRWGGSVKALEKPLEALVKTFDFSYGKNGQFGLSKAQLRLMLPIAVAGYIDAARDKLERWEVAIRAPITALYLGWGAEILEGQVLKRFGKRTPEIFDGNALKSLQTLAADAIKDAETRLKGQPTDAVNALAKQLYQQRLAAKGTLVLTPLFFSMSVVSFGVAMMNRYWTRQRFDRQQQQNNWQQLYRQFNPKPLEKPMAFSAVSSTNGIKAQ
jgi:hypothetical protein